MPKKIILVLVPFILLGTIKSSVAQDIFSYSYRSADGLDTDVIKCITQDSLGFIWIGSDDGLFRFDGVNFERYAEGAPGNFFKEFVKTSDGKLLGVHDMGVYVINPDIQKPTFIPLFVGNRSISDSTIWYPKHVFEDSRKRLWISEPQSLIKYEKGSWKRYAFGPEDNTTSFVRSFNYLDLDDGRLLMVSNPGNYFVYNETTDSFKRLSSSHHFVTYDIKKIGDRILIATDQGIKQITLTKDKINISNFEIRGIDNSLEYRHLQLLNEEQLIVSGIYDNTSIIDLSNDNTAKKLSTSEMFVNQSYVDDEGNIWLSTQKGILLLSLPEFRKIELNKPNNYIEALVTSKESEFIHALRSSSVWKINKMTEEPSLLINGDENDYFLSGVQIGEYLYLSSGYKLIKLKGDQIVDELNLQNYGRYIFDVVYDSISQKIWMSQESFKGIRQIDPENLSHESFGSEKGILTEISGIKVNSNGVYALSSNPDHYLYFKPHGEDRFRDVSIPFREPYRVGLVVDDLIQIDDMFILGSNYGMFVYADGEINKIEINLNFDNSAVRSLLLEQDYLWVATTAGLIRYGLKTHEYAQYSESSGLPVNTINKECLIIDQNKLWVGTSQGVAVTDYAPSNEPQKTRKPVILDFVANGKSMNTSPGINHIVPFDSYITISFASLLFPTNDMEYSYNIGGSWSAPQVNNQVNLGDLEDGSYNFEVRAKKTGNYHWSEPRTFQFVIKPPFYKTAPFYLSVLLILGVAVYATRYLTSKMEKRRQLLLTMLVEERTKELNKIKGRLEGMVKDRTEELEETVNQLQTTQNQLIQAEKMASLGVLTAGIAHEINNPVNYLQAGLYSVEAIIEEKEMLKADPELEEVVTMMRTGIDRITNIVKGLSRYSHGGEQLMESCDIHDIIKTCLIIMEHELKDRIEVQKELNAENPLIFAHDGSIHQLLINLISNAAHAIENTGKIKIGTENIENTILVKISDTGSGIDQQYLDKIFDPFFTTKAPGIGTGLGLYISKRIVTEHLGQINFESIKNKGTTVLITFKSWSNGDDSEKESVVRG
ncbi:MAG: hypothetical protein CMP48_09895 [Rickettsiales bacterium]|nr:hypothetical protein [Rickettsiales bacterium]